MTTVAFDVYGLPRAQGSKRAFVVNGKARMTEMAGPAGANWRDAVAVAAREQRTTIGRALDGPLVLYVTFRFPMPASARKTERARGKRYKAKAPDLSKLVRSLEDGLQAVNLIRDDARIASLIAHKVEVFDDWTGARITVTELSDDAAFGELP